MGFPGHRACVHNDRRDSSGSVHWQASCATKVKPGTGGRRSLSADCRSTVPPAVDTAAHAPFAMLARVTHAIAEVILSMMNSIASRPMLPPPDINLRGAT